MSGFSDYLTEDRRLAILRLLLDTGGTLNDSALLGLLERLGHLVSRDVVKGDLAWLREQSTVEVDELAAATGRVHVATIRQRGVDAASGRTTIPGIKRPSPRT